MKIELSENTKMHTAISLANRRRYYDALCIFAQIESYESVLNQIACLAEMQDVGYAVDTYYYAKRTYGSTHAVYSDVLLMGDAAKSIVQFCETNAKHARENDGAIHAEKTLLADFGAPDDEDDYSAPDLDYAADTVLYDDPSLSANNFYDVKSTRYFDSLRVNMEKCIMNGDEAGAKRYAKRLLDVETDHLPTLEAQISLTLYTEKYKKGFVYVERLAQTEGGSHAAVGGAIDIVMHLNPHKHLDILKILMQKALDVLEDVNAYDLEDYVYIATSLLCDFELAYKFAEALYRDYKHASLEALHVCACAFFNYGKWNMAKEASISLLRAVPKNDYARILSEYVRQTPCAKNQMPMETPPRVLRHFCMPTKVTLYAHRQLCAMLDADDKLKLTDDELFYISVLLAHCKYLILTNRKKEYMDIITFLRTILEVYDFADMEQFLTFAKSQLLSTMPDQCISETLVNRLIKFGVQEKIDVALPTGCYKLDIAKVDSSNAIFVRAFAVCASLVRIDSPKKYEKAFAEICDTVQVDFDAEDISYNLAFAMLCICIKGFAELPEAEFFVEGQYSLYREYRAMKKLK